MADLVYSDPQDVITYTGLKPKDLGLDTAQELEDTVNGWLLGIKDFIDRNRNRDYHKEGAVPYGIHQIALRAAANMTAVAILRRETPIVQQDDFTIRMVEDQVFTEALMKDLNNYLPKPRIGMLVVKREEVG